MSLFALFPFHFVFPFSFPALSLVLVNFTGDSSEVLILSSYSLPPREYVLIFIDLFQWFLDIFDQ